MPTMKLTGLLRLVAVIAIFMAGVWSQSSGVIEEFLFYIPDIQFLTVQHLWLTALSGGLAILVAVPLGIILSRPSMTRYAESAM
ncbi:hypothetical protein ACFO0O_17550 [Cobetia amphilecti]|uniref:Uncharacterized protein n=5 Tax=Halomonadaceae TaxID=28256 RepID=A0ABT6UW34_9GAMM|nr:hypothetical protein [Cobetia amphilecti]MDI5886004.1 hypothetical protein [Cobetia amphilecti]